uniref:Uncharacterized protein n=1 Tax=Ceratitis capitata TaxID=7213 RepID=W8CB17_CERCA
MCLLCAMQQPLASLLKCKSTNTSKVNSHAHTHLHVRICVFIGSVGGYSVLLWKFSSPAITPKAKAAATTLLDSRRFVCVCAVHLCAGVYVHVFGFTVNKAI